MIYPWQGHFKIFLLTSNYKITTKITHAAVQKSPFVYENPLIFEHFKQIIWIFKPDHRNIKVTASYSAILFEDDDTISRFMC